MRKSLRGVLAKIDHWFGWFVERFGPPDPRAHEDYQLALEDPALPQTDADLSSLPQFADRKYREAKEVFDALDRKATALFGIATTLATLLVGSLTTGRVSLFFASFPLLVFLLAMFCALRVQLPALYPGMFSIRRAVEHATSGTLDAELIAVTHRAVVAFRVVTDWKSRMIAWSTMLIALGLLLVVPMAAAVSQGVTQATSSQSSVSK